VIYSGSGFQGSLLRILLERAENRQERLVGFACP
jgi:hypothetical protein